MISYLGCFEVCWELGDNIGASELEFSSQSVEFFLESLLDGWVRVGKVTGVLGDLPDLGDKSLLDQVLAASRGGREGADRLDVPLSGKHILGLFL